MAGCYRGGLARDTESDGPRRVDCPSPRSSPAGRHCSATLNPVEVGCTLLSWQARSVNVCSNIFTSDLADEMASCVNE